MRFSISDILPFLDCELKGATRWLLQRWTPSTRSMRLGTAVHKYCDPLLSTGRPDHNYASTVDPDLVEDLLPIIEAADRYLAPPPFKVLSTETPVVYPLRGGHELVGRLDAVLDCDDFLYSGQWKTIGKGVDVGKALEKVRMSPHEIFYRVAGRFNGIALVGTALGTFRTYLTKAQKEQNVPIFQFHELPCSPDEDDEAFTDILEACDRFIACAQGKRPMRNWTACTSIFGDCPLHAHCHHGADEGDCVSVPLENRYADLVPHIHPGTSGTA